MRISIHGGWAEFLLELFQWVNSKELPFTCDIDLDDGRTLRGAFISDVTGESFRARSGSFNWVVGLDDVELITINL